MSDRYPRLAIFLIAACAHLTGATAPNGPEAWRCTPNSYSDQPCAEGKAIDMADPRSHADRRAADAATRRDRAAADALERERLKREALARRDSRPIVIGNRTPAEAAPPPHATKPGGDKKKKAKGGKEPAYFTAHGAGAPGKQKK